MKDKISLKERFLKLIREYFERLAIKKYLRFLNIQFIIQVSFAIACVYLVISFVYPLVGLGKIRLPKQEVRLGRDIAGVVNRTVSSKDVKTCEYYLEGIKGKEIFTSVSLAAAGNVIGVAGADIIKDINLVGIITGENPQAIIEDKKAQKTYYVTKGQLIGEFKVEDIQERKVILNYQGQNYELPL